jgi:hypothetical protein
MQRPRPGRLHNMEREKSGVKETSRRKTLRVATRNSLKPRRLPNETPRDSSMGLLSTGTNGRKTPRC